MLPFGSSLDPHCYSHNDWTSNRKATLLYNMERYKMSADDTILTGPSADGLSFGPMAAREGMGVSFLLRRYACNSEMHQTKRKTTLTDDMPGVFASSVSLQFL